jgi:uncharacterized protein (TIGR02217 family)
MTTFLEARIRECVTENTVFEVDHPARTKIYGSGGRLEQVFGDTPPLHKVDLAFGIRSVADYQACIDAFYILMFTPYSGLRVKNWNDYRAVKANSTLTALGGGTWQLQRKHTFGSITLKRNIKKPCASPVVQIYDSSDALLASTVDSTTGIATVTGTPSYWIGEFDLPMTFSENKWRAQLQLSTADLYMANEPVPMEEVLL